MKKFLVMSSLIVSTNIWATGGVIGGGGMGVVCQNSEGEETVTLLDIFEAKVAGKKFMDLEGELTSDLSTISQKLYPTNPEKGAKFFVNALMLSGWFKNIPSDTVLNPTDDALPALLPKNCVIKQIASYQNEQLIYIDQTLYDKMDYLNQLALVVHEYIYKNERDGDVKDSRYTRLITGMLLDDSREFPANVRLEETDLAIKHCESVGAELESDFYVFPDGHEVQMGYNLVVFNKLNGHTMLNMNVAPVSFPEAGTVKTEKGSLLAAGMGQTEMTFKNNARGLFVSWAGHFPGDKFKNVEFVCNDL